MRKSFIIISILSVLATLPAMLFTIILIGSGRVVMYTAAEAILRWIALLLLLTPTISFITHFFLLKKGWISKFYLGFSIINSIIGLFFLWLMFDFGTM